jgi:predicted DNA binding CopG/RHH family protein
MSEDLKIPDFKNEAEEAHWWDAHQNDIASAFERAAANGTLGHGTVRRKGATPSTSIRLDQEDIARARVLANRKGLRYQTYLKMLIREALIAEEKKLAG